MEERELAEANFNDLGPVPRLCIDFSKDPGRRMDYEGARHTIISDLTPEKIRNFVALGGAKDMDAQSHSIFLIRRPEIDDVRTSHLTPISPAVEMKLMAAIKLMRRLDQIDLYRRFASPPPSRVVAGLLYEPLGHTRLCEGTFLWLREMTRHTEQTLIHWRCDSEAEDLGILVRFPPKEAIVYKPNMTSVQRSRLHVPKARNQAGFDSFFLGEFLYIFQLTIARKRDIKPRIRGFFDRLEDLPPKELWRFVLITPPDIHVDVSAPAEVATFLEDVTLYSAHLELATEDDYFPE
jgi:hypothetical protein